MSTHRERFENGIESDLFYDDNLAMHVVHDNTEYYKHIGNMLVRVFPKMTDIDDYDFWASHTMYTLIKDERGSRIHASYGEDEPECRIVE